MSTAHSSVYILKCLCFGFSLWLLWRLSFLSAPVYHQSVCVCVSVSARGRAERTAAAALIGSNDCVRRLQYVRDRCSPQQYERCQGEAVDDTGGASVSQSSGGDDAVARDRDIAVGGRRVSSSTGGNTADRDDRDDAINTKTDSCNATFLDIV